MSIETDSRHQVAVLWQAEGVDNYGRTTVSHPIELRVRWESISKEMSDPQGNSIAVDTVVVVDRNIPIKSILWLGRLKDYNLLASSADLKEVVSFSSVPDIKGKQYRRIVGAVRYGDVLPTIA